ncbi:MAG: hypothetical protein AB7O97_02940 [Planctomycetota bacterium]
MIRPLPLRSIALALCATATTALLPAQAAGARTRANPEGNTRAELQSELDALRAELKELRTALRDLQGANRGTGAVVRRTEGDAKAKGKAKAKVEGKPDGGGTVWFGRGDDGEDARVEVRGHAVVVGGDDDGEHEVRTFVLGGDDAEGFTVRVDGKELRATGKDGKDVLKFDLDDAKAGGVWVLGEDGKVERIEGKKGAFRAKIHDALKGKAGDGDGPHVLRFRTDGEDGGGVLFLDPDGKKVRFETKGNVKVGDVHKAKAKVKAKAKGKAKGGCCCDCTCCDEGDGNGDMRFGYFTPQQTLQVAPTFRFTRTPSTFFHVDDGKCAPARGDVQRVRVQPVTPQLRLRAPAQPVEVRTKARAKARNKLISI